MNVYVIDACALIDAAHNYNMSKKTFSYIWDSFEKEIREGRLISCMEIYEELKDDDLAAWAKQHKEAFIPLTREIQEKTVEVLKKHPEIIKIRSSKNSNGDPFLIATAMTVGGIIVTNEGTKHNGIPEICQSLGISYINLKQYLDEILE